MCRCDISKCKAWCCYNVPMPANLLYKHLSKIVTQPYFIVDSDGGKIENISTIFNTNTPVLPITDLTGSQRQKCPFLTNDCKCNIYEDRPEFCKQYGHPEVLSLFGCRFLGQKEVRDFMEVKVKDILKNYGLCKELLPDTTFALEDMYNFVQFHPEGTVKDMIKNMAKYGK